MIIPITDPTLVVLIGAAGSGKSTFAHRRFRTTEVVSSDHCRALVCDDENDQAATDDAFDLLHLILARRLARQRTTVIDATNVQQSSRASLVAAAAEWHVPVIAIVFLLPEEVCQRRNLQRTNRRVPAEVVSKQMKALMESNAHLEAEGFAFVHRLENAAQADSATVTRR